MSCPEGAEDQPAREPAPSVAVTVTSVALEFCEARPSVYQPLEAGTQFADVEAATQALRAQAAKLAAMRALGAGELAERGLEPADLAGYDKHYVDICYDIAYSDGTTEKERAHLRFDVSDEGDDLDVGAALAWHALLGAWAHERKGRQHG